VVDLVSYADDVNPLVITRNKTPKRHKQLYLQVDQGLEMAAAAHQLTWDPTKSSSVPIGTDGPIERTTTLGIHINSHLSFQAHIDVRTQKSAKLAHVIYRLGNSNGGMSPTELRALYTGAIRLGVAL